MSLQEFADKLAESHATAVITDNFWIVPTVQSIHIIAVAIIFTGTVVIAGRALGVMGGEWTLSRWGERLLPGVWIAFAVQLLTGTILIVGEPARELPNWAFQVKVVLLVVMVGLLWLLSRRVRAADTAAIGGATRALALVMVLLLLAIICAGRWIAYV